MYIDMKVDLEPSLDRWVEAQILDRQQADRIKQFEIEAAPRRRSRWPMIAAVAFGGAMLAAGVLLFVSAHWDRLSPFERMTLLVVTVGAFHAAGAFAAERFHAASMALHAAGTVALGGAIAMAGQIFNMQEHWPTAVLLWSAGAVAGWLLLRDWPQLAIAAVLVPWWIAGEWSEAVRARDAAPVIGCGVLLLAISYFSARMPGDRGDHTRIALAWLGGLALVPAAFAVALERAFYSSVDPANAGLMAFGWSVALLVPLVVAYALRGRAAWMNAVAAIWVLALHASVQARMDVLIYAVCGIGSAAMVAWGIREFRAERINLGMGGFALTIVFFFFSSVMDRLGRSASLISLGIVCVAGGWYWERLRRRLVSRLASGGPQ
jgi:uncharacterized membrane protein